MQTLSLKAEPRTLAGRKTYKLRVNDQIPAVVYGSDIKPANITLVAGDFLRALRQAGESTLIDLTVDGGQAMKVLIQDVQRDPVKHDVIHVDFRQVNMNKPIEAKIQLKFVGESMAVKALGGTFVEALGEIEVKCLPGKLVHEIEVDISSLKTFEDAIHVKDIVVPEGMEVLSAPNMTIAIIEAPRSEAEMAALNEAVTLDVTQVEVEKKGKEEEGAEGAAEGEAAPAAEAKPESK